MREKIEEIYRTESRRVLATLIRLVGSFELAEEALQEAFAAALKQWEHDGVPDNPRAWLVSTGRFKAIDQIRRRAKHDESMTQLVHEMETFVDDDISDEAIEDDQLRLIFTCCHPGLAVEAQLALTLREVCGLTTEEIARAFLKPTPTVAQRIVRAKAKIRDSRVPYEVPGKAELPGRLQSVLQAIYLVFNEGYAATSGEDLVRHDLCAEAIRLARLLVSLMPHPEVLGLLALMLLQDSRRSARTGADGELVRLEDQNRDLWNSEQIEEGAALIRRSLVSRNFGSYTLQAAIAAVHCEAPRYEDTDWKQIVGLYRALYEQNPTPVVALNQAVAVSMVEGPEVGLARVDSILASGDLSEYHLAHAARADFLRQLQRFDEARSAYEHALSLTELAAEQRFIERRLADLPSD